MVRHGIFCSICSNQLPLHIAALKSRLARFLDLFESISNFQCQSSPPCAHLLFPFTPSPFTVRKVARAHLVLYPGAICRFRALRIPSPTFSSARWTSKPLRTRTKSPHTHSPSTLAIMASTAMDYETANGDRFEGMVIFRCFLDFQNPAHLDASLCGRPFSLTAARQKTALDTTGIVARPRVAMTAAMMRATTVLPVGALCRLLLATGQFSHRVPKLAMIASLTQIPELIQRTMATPRTKRVPRTLVPISS